MGFLDYRPDFAAGKSQNTGNPVLWICTENGNGIIWDTIYDGTGFHPNSLASFCLLLPLQAPVTASAAQYWVCSNFCVK